MVEAQGTTSKWFDKLPKVQHDAPVMSVEEVHSLLESLTTDNNNNKLLIVDVRRADIDVRVFLRDQRPTTKERKKHQG